MPGAGDPSFRTDGYAKLAHQAINMRLDGTLGHEEPLADLTVCPAEMQGSKRQVIEAQRLGANSWVDKDQAGEELLDQCATLLASSLGQALDFGSIRLPTPLAYRFARYARTSVPDKKMTEGLLVLEAVLRFAALLGLSSTPPQPLPGITLERMRTPSMGTWFDLCAALGRAPGAGEDFTRLLSFLIPERAHHQLIHDFVSIRNDIAHGRETPDHVQGQRLDALLRRFAHRAQSAWRADIAVPISMTYDGSTYCVEVLRLSGIGTPSPSTVKSQAPVVTGELILLSASAKLSPLAPWLIVQRREDHGELRCLQFDGLQRTKGRPGVDTPLKYSSAYDRKTLEPTPIPPGGTWQALSTWITR